MPENKMINQESSSTHPPTTPETLITPAETANATGLTLRTVINRAEKGKITAKGNDAAPSPDLADAKDDAKVQKSDRSAIQDMLAFL